MSLRRFLYVGAAGIEEMGVPAKWQAAQWPSTFSSSGGSTWAQICWASGQRVRNRQPEGGLNGLGTSPTSTIRLRLAFGTGSGMAESSAIV